MKLKFVFAGMIVMAMGINSVNAQAVRGKNQRQRIREGVRSGELTKAEAVNLHRDQKEIRQEVKDAKADGVVTTAEKKEIRQDQRKESRKIYRKKHNNRDRN